MSTIIAIVDLLGEERTLGKSPHIGKLYEAYKYGEASRNAADLRQKKNCSAVEQG